MSRRAREAFRLRGPAGVLLSLGMLALAAPFISVVRPGAVDGRAAVDITVSSSADRGPGTLREAIYTANSAPSRARIRVEVPTVELRTPLPPLVNPDGVVLVAGRAGATVDGAAVLDGPVLDIRAPGSVVRGLTLRGAPVLALVVRGDGILVDSVRVERNGTGIAHRAGGSFSVERSTFVENEVGLRLDVEGARVPVHDNTFERNGEAAIWSMGPAEPDLRGGDGVVISGNTFREDRISLVVGNRSVVVTDNDFVGAREAAIHVGGQGVRVQGNRILGGIAYGILAYDALGTEISSNEADGNRAVGILINSSRNMVVRDNRSYRNGYGIVSVFGDPRSPILLSANTTMANDFDGLTVIGGSPILRGNQASGNGLAGLRILHFQPRVGGRIPAEPLLELNQFRGNGIDEPVRGVYVVPEPGND